MAANLANVGKVGQQLEGCLCTKTHWPLPCFLPGVVEVVLETP